MTEKSKFVLGRIENIGRKGENAGFPTTFSRRFLDRLVKGQDCVVNPIN